MGEGAGSASVEGQSCQLLGLLRKGMSILLTGGMQEKVDGRWRAFQQRPNQVIDSQMTANHPGTCGKHRLILSHMHLTFIEHLLCAGYHGHTAIGQRHLGENKF